MKNFAAIVSVGLALAALAPARVRAAPIEFRGVVEGFYGRPWGTEERLETLRFMGEHKMNTFIYGPKDDPFHHSKWREPYPKAEVANFKRLLECAKQNGVNFYWAIHLGGTFQSNPADFAALFRKLGAMYEIGFRSFAVFFDDFGDRDAKAHATICNRVQKEFLDAKGDCSPLIMCPRTYSGNNSPYQRTLGAELDRRVKIMWTGRGVCDDIRAGDVAQVTAALRRPPLVWWNWPVNDYCRSHILLGRAYGLDKCELAGFVTNPMENCEANKIALYSVAKWCMDPEGFDSEACWRESFERLYPARIAGAMRTFAEHNSDQGPNVHNYRREESVRAAPLCSRAREEFRQTKTLSAGTAAEVEKLFMEVGNAAALLLRELPKEKGLGWELRGWLENEKFLMQQGVKALTLIREAGDRKKCAAAIGAVAKARAAARKSAEAHKAKFAAATFENDRGRQRSPEASAKELKPLVEELLLGALKERYRERTGKDFAAATGLKATTNSKSPALRNLVAGRNGASATILAVNEPVQVLPNETFGISVPDSWQTTYFHAKLGLGEAVKAGVIEVSRDGRAWQKLATQNTGAEMQLKLSPSDGWRHARYRNASKNPVEVKINLFKFDITASESPIDDLVKALQK